MKGVGIPGEWNFFTRSIKQLFDYRRNMHIDVAKTGAAETSLDEFINKRSKAKGRERRRRALEGIHAPCKREEVSGGCAARTGSRSYKPRRGGGGVR